MGASANGSNAENDTFGDPQTPQGGDGFDYGLLFAYLTVYLVMITLFMSVVITLLRAEKLEAGESSDLERDEIVELKDGNRGGPPPPPPNTTFDPQMISRRHMTPPLSPKSAPEEDPFGTFNEAFGQDCVPHEVAKPMPAIITTRRAVGRAEYSTGPWNPPVWKHINWGGGSSKKEPILPQVEPGRGSV